MGLALAAVGLCRGLLFAITILGVTVADTPAAPRRGEPAIWTIEKPNGATITLFGSVHLLPDGEEWRTKALAAAYDKADVIVLETDLDQMQTNEMQAYLSKHALNDGDTTLSDLLSPEQKATVTKGAVKAGLGLSAMERFRPWFAALQLSVANAVAQGLSPDQGVDQQIAQQGKADDKAFDYFETAREQLDLFIELPEKEQVSFLVLGAAELIDRPDALKQLIDAWSTGNVAEIDDLMNRGLQDAPVVAKALLADRNARWARKIEDFYLKDRNSYLIVVGTGHLVGDAGVPELLRDAGVEVKGP
ncbi:MAG: TraB/GumN family protein [Alphaproteobacteria bacterium]|nr:TraB/GumN family protein [Alphaproteobacteria bacterium]